MPVREPLESQGGCTFRDDGFTFLEIIVSLVILSLVMVTLFHLQSGTVRLASAGNFRSVAPLLARNQLSELLDDADAGSSPSGDFGDAYPGYAWAAQVSRPERLPDGPVSEAQADHLIRITVRITGPDSAETFDLTAIRYRIDENKNRLSK